MKILMRVIPCLLLAACFRSPTNNSASTERDSEPIRIQIGGEPSTLDPARVIDQYGFSIIRNVVRGLFVLDGEGKLQNGLVDSYEVSPDGLIYSFKLKPDAKWSDGKTVSIDDCIYGLRRAVDPKTAAPNADSFFAIKGAKEIFNGQKPVDALGVSQNNGSLRIELVQPHPGLLLNLTLPVAAPARRDFYDQNKGKWDYRFPVTGPYKISSYKTADQIELEPNPYNRKPHQRKVIFKILTEEITAMNLFESGRLDIISTITPTEIERLKKKGLLKFVPSTTVFYFSFNSKKPPFDDLEWRKAVAASVDREGLEKILHGTFESTTSYLPKSISGSLPYKKPEFSDSVRKVANDKRHRNLKLSYGASSFTRTVGEKVQSDLMQKLGLRVELQPVELKTLLAQLRADPPQMYFLGMSAIYDDPMNQLAAFANFTAPNFSRYQNPEFEKILLKIQQMPEGTERTKLAREANQILVEKDVIAIPILMRMQVYGVSKSLQGFQLSPYQVIQLDQLTK